MAEFRSYVGHRKLEIVNTKYFSENDIYMNRTHLPNPPTNHSPRLVSNVARKTTSSSSSPSSQNFKDSERKRRNRVTKYKVSAVEGRVKTSFRNAVRVIKARLAESSSRQNRSKAYGLRDRQSEPATVNWFRKMPTCSTGSQGMHTQPRESYSLGCIQARDDPRFRAYERSGGGRRSFHGETVYQSTLFGAYQENEVVYYISTQILSPEASRQSHIRKRLSLQYPSVITKRFVPLSFEGWLTHKYQQQLRDH
ncbi:hypothetical protein IFM89_010573 [Coptis chinensis]|uniref:Uncharacterized protein n=1 Tax=Coptis chinensis TaxID=261450 RepID=A0A835M863_9MAGN|nr:hypothetical protein IFM89_010573 [Coptis chinensis]